MIQRSTLTRKTQTINKFLLFLLSNNRFRVFILRLLSSQLIPSPFQIHSLISSLVLVIRCLPSIMATEITVAQDGSANHTTIQQAIDAVPLDNTARTIIRVAPGVYKQPLFVAKSKNFIALVGSIPENTIITWNNTASKIEHHLVHPLPFRHNYTDETFAVKSSLLTLGFLLCLF